MGLKCVLKYNRSYLIYILDRIYPPSPFWATARQAGLFGFLFFATFQKKVAKRNPPAAEKIILILSVERPNYSINFNLIATIFKDIEIFGFHPTVVTLEFDYGAAARKPKK